MKIFQIPFVVVLLLYAQISVGQNTISVAATVDKASIIIGEPAQLKLEAFFPSNNTPSFFAVDSFQHFEILNSSKIDTVPAEGGTKLSRTLTLTSWDSGAWNIPALPLQNSSRIRTQPIQIAVGYSPMAPDQQYHDVKDILAVPQATRVTWYWYVIGAVLLLILFLLLFPKKKKSTEPVVNMQDVYKQTLAQLDALKSRTGEDGKEYFTSLILIFRNYLQQRKNIQSHAKTTDDISRQLRTAQLEERDYNDLVQTLQLSDFVKFAKYVPTITEKEEALNTIKKSIVTIEHNKA